MREGEEMSQRTYMHDPQTQTSVWGWPEGSGGLGGGGQGWGEMGTSVVVSTVKIKFKKQNSNITSISAIFIRCTIFLFKKCDSICIYI